MSKRNRIPVCPDIMMKGNKTWLFLLWCLLFVLISGNSICENTFPPSDDASGLHVPFVNMCISKEMKAKTMLEDQRTKEIYIGVSSDDYEKIGRCYGKSGFAVDSKVLKDNSIILELKKENKNVCIEYNAATNLLTVYYPDDYTEDLSCYDVQEDDICIFPDLEEAFGAVLPRISTVLKRQPDIQSRTTDGKTAEIYYNFYEEDYNLFGDYLMETGFSVVNNGKTDDVFILNLERNTQSIVLKYDPVNHLACVIYNIGSLLEPVVTQTPSPAVD